MTARVLLVEDDPDIREDVAFFLADAGYAVLEAANGRAALDTLAREGGADVLLVDLMMPVMNGWELREALLSDGRFAAIPWVIMSGRPDLRSTAEALGAKAHIRKPIDVDALVGTLTGICPVG